MKTTQNAFNWQQTTTFEQVLAISGENASDFETTSEKPLDIAAMRMKRILLINQVFQDGKDMDPNNNDQWKWFPVWDLVVSKSNPSGFRFDFSGYTLTRTISVLGPLLWLPSEEVCDHVAKHFEEEFKNVIINKK